MVQTQMASLSVKHQNLQIKMETVAPQGQGGPPQQGGDQMPDLAAAAAKLGITEETLMNALGKGQPNFEEAANILGIDVETLMNAIGMPPQQGQGGGGAPQGK